MSNASRNATRPHQYKKNEQLEEGEERCYYFSPFTLRNERDLLLRYRVEDFDELLMRAYDSLHGIVGTMKNIQTDTPISSTIVFGLGYALEHVAMLISAIQDAYSTVEFFEE